MSSYGADASDAGASSLDLQETGLTTFDGMQHMPSLEAINARNNRLTSFYGIPTQPNLKFLHVDGNSITSFLGMSHQPRLEILSIVDNPICSHPHFRILALLACGESLKIVNYRAVVEEERNIVRMLGGSGSWAARCVSYGWTDLQLCDLPEEYYEAMQPRLKSDYADHVAGLDLARSFTVIAQRTFNPNHDIPDQTASSYRPPAAPAIPEQSELHTGSGFTPRRSSPPTRRMTPDRTVSDRGHAPPVVQESHQRKEEERAPSQLTVDEFNSFYRTTGMPHDISHGQISGRSVPLAPSASHETRTQVQSMPHILDRDGVTDVAHGADVVPAEDSWGTPASYSAALSTARALKEKFLQEKREKDAVNFSGYEPTRANLLPIEKRLREQHELQSSFLGDGDVVSGGHHESIGAHTVGHPSHIEVEADPTPVPFLHDDDPALVLLQGELGCLSSMIIDNVDATITSAAEHEVIENAMCKISGSTGVLYVYEGSDLVGAFDLGDAADIGLDKIKAEVTVRGVINQHVRTPEDTPGGNEMTLVLRVRQANPSRPKRNQKRQPSPTASSLVEALRHDHSDHRADGESSAERQRRSLLAKGIFKMLMVFKCTPDELATFYSKVVVTEKSGRR